MSGGGNKSTQAVADATAKATPAQAVQMLNMPAYMPGQQEALAQQLAAGFGGTPASYQTGILSMNKPVSVPVIGNPSMLDAYMQQAGITSSASGDATSSTDAKTPLLDAWRAKGYGTGSLQGADAEAWIKANYPGFTG